MSDDRERMMHAPAEDTMRDSMASEMDSVVPDWGKDGMKAEMVGGDAEAYEITLGDLLKDSAAALEESGMKGLARSCKMAAAMLGDMTDVGEAWIVDIMEALAEAEAVVHDAEVGGTVKLEKLRAAIQKVGDWGLEPQYRMGNAFTHLTRVLSLVITTLDDDTGVTKVENLRSTIEQAIKALGYGDEEAED